MSNAAPLVKIAYGETRPDRLALELRRRGFSFVVRAGGAIDLYADGAWSLHLPGGWADVTAFSDARDWPTATYPNPCPWPS